MKKKSSRKVDTGEGPQNGLILPINSESFIEPEDNPELFAMGFIFEKWVVRKFPRKKYFLEEWRGDKYVDGIFPISNCYPDLLFKYKKSESQVENRIAIECKWRKWDKDEFNITHTIELGKYKKFELDFNIPVNIVIGIGGDPNDPEKICIVELKEIASDYIEVSTLEQMNCIYSKGLSTSKFEIDSKGKLILCYDKDL